MASAIVPAMLKRLVAMARAAAAVAPVLAMLLLPVLHATAAPAHKNAKEHVLVLAGKDASAASGHDFHYPGHTTAVTPDGQKAKGPSCVDMAGCPLHAQLPGAMADLGGSVLTHAVGDGESSDFHAISHRADSPPPRSHA